MCACVCMCLCVCVCACVCVCVCVCVVRSKVNITAWNVGTVLWLSDKNYKGTTTINKQFIRGSP